ncbi:mCG1041620 [Mus musculus]|nr:mCG1041620 [Mus musculus]
MNFLEQVPQNRQAWFRTLPKIKRNQMISGKQIFLYHEIENPYARIPSGASKQRLLYTGGNWCAAC